MKILQVINSLSTGGAEKLILDTLPIYQKKGIDMDLAVLVDHNYPFLQQLKEVFEGKVYVLGSGSVYHPKSILPLARIMKKYDIVHVHLFPAQYYALAANAINKGKSKLIFTEHCTSNRRIRNKIFKPIEKIAYSKYDKTVCITSEIQDIIHEHALVDVSNLPIIENGVDLEKIKNAQPIPLFKIHPDLKKEDVILTQVAAFRLQKDQPTAIKALQHLPNNYKLLLVGDGEQRDNCKKLADKINLSPRVYFLGKRNDVPAILKSSDYILLSTHFEGLSLSSIEGMASGKPFIASDVPGITEVVKGYGRLFPDSDEVALAKEILLLQKDNNLYQDTVNKCLNRAQEYDINKMVQDHINLYHAT